MIISYKLLVSICKDIKKIPLEEIFNAFNLAGIEVETCQKHPQNIGLKIAKIKAVSKHPNSNKLHLVQIEDLNQKQYHVVCGANNLSLNDYVIYAPVGSIINGQIEIKPKEIKGINSMGMICGYQELTNINVDCLATKDKEGVIILKEKDLTSTDPVELLNLNDIIWDLSIPSNRNDLNSYYGIINEIAPILNINFKLDSQLENLTNNQNLINLDIDANCCSDFGLLVVKDLPQFHTTWKQKEILIAHNFKIQNNWLDFLNIITLICNNPIHIYDLDKITSNQSLNIKVKHLPVKKQILALDGNQYNIDNEIIGIYAADKLINIAGIIGLDEYKYTTESKNVLIEVANFNYLLIRKMINNLKISSKSALLFSKPISSWITINAFIQIYDYFSSLSCSTIACCKFNIKKPTLINFDYDIFRKFIGVNINDDEIQKGLKKLNMKLINDNIIETHPARLDLTNQYEIFEELLKLIDINKLQPKKIDFDIKHYHDIHYDNELLIRNFLINNGFYEVKTYNLVAKQDLFKFNFFNSETSQVIKVANPLSLSHAYYRLNTIDSLLKTIKYNIDHKRELNNIFEIQSLIHNNNLYTKNLSFLLLGNVNQKIINYHFHWNLISIKSLIKNLLVHFTNDITFAIATKNTKEIYDGQQLEILYNNQIIGYVGMIRASILKEYNINLDCFCATINLDNFINKTNSSYRVVPVSDFPIVVRDINIEIDINKKININQIIKKLTSINNVFECKVIDFFVKENKNIYTCELKILSYEKTLTNEEINNIVNKATLLIKEILS